MKMKTCENQLSKQRLQHTLQLIRHGILWLPAPMLVKACREINRGIRVRHGTMVAMPALAMPPGFARSIRSLVVFAAASVAAVVVVTVILCVGREVFLFSFG
jgi:hypothetical protein